jgi:hypothetical protein
LSRLKNIDFKFLSKPQPLVPFKENNKTCSTVMRIQSYAKYRLSFQKKYCEKIYREKSD